MKKTIFMLHLLPVLLMSQNLDSLYTMLLNSKGASVKDHHEVSSINGKISDKCGFGLYASVKSNLNEYSDYEQNIIQKIMERPVLTTSIISPSGIFRIHYDESGINQPEYDINDLAAAFDSSYNFEVNVLGYPAPPTDGTRGGDDKYDIYVKNLNGGLYGATTPEVTIGEGKYLSYIEIDNSFRESEGYNSFGIDGARVTAAHEFHHAIQIGNYLFRDDDLFYYELTSTAFEEFVYDNVNDYYAYMYSFFRNTNNKFESNSGYNLAIWNIFLQEKFNSEDPLLGHDIVKRSWEYMINNRAMVAIAKAMNDYGKSFPNEFNEFGDWLNFTQDNAKEGEFFEEALNYPSVRSNYSVNLEENQKTLSIECEPTSINFLTFYHNSQGVTDTVIAVISNSDAYGSLGNGNSIQVDLTLSDGPFEDANSINDYYYSKVSSPSSEFIQTSYIINNELAFKETNDQVADFAYPQPFKYEINSVINIPTHSDLSNESELNIYSSDMNLVYSGIETIFVGGNVIRWDAKDNNGNRLSSGIYVYVTRVDGKIKKGKLVILN